MDFIDWRLKHLLWNCPNMNVSGLHWWSVNIGSGNGLVPSGNKPLPEVMLTQILSPYGVTRPQWVNSLTLRQNDHHFTDIVKCIFINENCCILVLNSLRFDYEGPINHMPRLVPIVAWFQIGAKPLSETVMVYSLQTHICITPPQWVDSGIKSLDQIRSQFFSSQLYDVQI